jgi:hypothetical protein
MKTDFKEKLRYWAESLVLMGGALIGVGMCCAGLYAIYTIIKAVIG